MQPREQISEALFAKLTASGFFKTTGRRLQPWTQIAELPALFLVRADEEYPEGPVNRPRQVAHDYTAWLYTRTTSPKDTPEGLLNDMLDQVEQSIAPPTSFRDPQTLGLAAIIACRIKGKVETEIGHQTGQAFARVPIEVLVAELHP